MPFTKEQIIRIPNPHLRTKSSTIEADSSQLKSIIQKMKEATLDWDRSREHEVGIALAAVQIDFLSRIVIIREDFDDKENLNFNIYINPKIVHLSGAKTTDFEGCLSVPDIYGKVPRYNHIDIEYLDEKLNKKQLSADGLLARALQHEIDHTNGILFIDLIKQRKNAFYNLNQSGKLEPIKYDQIASNHLLWQ